MKIKVSHIAISLIAFAFASCSEDDLTQYVSVLSSHEELVSISLDPKAYGSALESRSLPSDLVDEGTGGSNTISDLWLVEFDHTGKQIGTPRYFNDPAAMTAVPVIKPDIAGIDYTIVAIANTGNDLLLDQLASCGDLKDLWKLSYEFLDETDGYTKEENVDTGRLVMNGFQTINSTTSALSIPLLRNVAKISIDITCKSTSGIKIKKVRLCKVPARISYADQLAGNIGVAMAYNCSTISLPYEEWTSESADSDEKMSLLYYVPRNMQGDSDSQSSYLKNNYAPPVATFLEIIGNDVSDNSVMRYRFYIGKNMTSNFDIEPNYHYHLPVVISGKGDSSLDARVESFGSTSITMSSNSYILSYNNDLEAYTTASIALDRVNYFWSHKNITDTDANKYLIHGTTQWVAQVIWQDTDEDIFHFCNPDGSDLMEKPHYYHGVGFEGGLNVKATGRGSGNVLIGIRKDDPNWKEDTDGYMWSWHLWISEYNPNCNTIMTETTFIRPVDGGYVHRYDTNYWKNSVPVGVYIMDRNFGAITSDAITSYTPNAERYRYFGLYYNFGRKDPFPLVGTKLYKYVESTDNANSKSRFPNIC